MSFELTNASASLQSLMNDTFKEFLNEFVIVYLNDILIYSKNKKQHHEHVKKVLKKIQRIGFFVKSKKCAWNVTEVEFLKHIIITERIRMNPKKIKAIMKWPTPKNIKDVQGFTRLINYYRKYVDKYSNKAAPLTNMTKKEIEFH